MQCISKQRTQYHKIWILSTGACFWNYQSETEWLLIIVRCLYSWGADKGMQIFANSWTCIQRPCLIVSFYAIEDKYWRKFATTFESQIGNLLPFVQQQVPFMWGTYFCMGAGKHNMVVVSKRVPKFMRCFLCGCLLLWFYNSMSKPHLNLAVLF